MRILIVDDHRLFAEAIVSTLEDEGFSVVGVAERGDVAMEMAERDRPEIVLVDIGLPDRSGLSVGQELLERFPEMKVVALTALADPLLVREAVRAGFQAYILKDTTVSRFVSSVRIVAEGDDVVLPHGLARGAAGGRSASEAQADLLVQQLSRREREVLGLLAEGASGRQIAASLGVSPNTVRTHVQSILTKLQVNSRLEAVAFATRHGFIERRRRDAV